MSDKDLIDDLTKRMLDVVNGKPWDFDQEIRLLAACRKRLEEKDSIQSEVNRIIERDISFEAVKAGVKASGFTVIPDEAHQSQCSQVSDTFRKVFLAMQKVIMEESQ